MAQKKRKRSQSIQIIKKSNDLIEARYRFDIWETRVFLSVLSHIHRDDEDFQAYRIRYNEMIKSFGLKSHQSYDLLRKGAKSLMSKTFRVNNTVDGFDRVKEYHIIRTVDYLKEGQDGAGIENQEYIDITVEPEMKPLLLQLQRNFTAYNLKHVAKLGAQPVRLYELLKQYESIGNRKLLIEDMRRMLEYENEYPRFADFYRYFIKPAVAAINKNTDIEVYKEEKIKRGRRVHGIHFYFRAKNKQMKIPIQPIQQRPAINFSIGEANEMTNELTLQDQLFEKHRDVVVGKFGVTPSVFMKLLETHDEGHLEQAIRVTRRANYNQQIKSNIAGFFIKALKEGFTDTKEEIQKGRVAAEKEKAKKALQAKYNKEVNEIIRAITKENPDITNQAISSLSGNYITKAILDEKESELGRSLEVEDFRKYKVLREMVKGKIMEMEVSRFQELKTSFAERQKSIR